MSVDVEAAKAMLRANEGVRTHAYYDSKTIPTIGVGFNLRRPDASIRCAEVGANRSALVLGRDGLSCDQIEQLLEFDLQDVLGDLGHLFKGFDELPASLTLVLVDMRFNLGPERFRAFAPTLDLIRERKYASAANRIARTPYAKQVGPRAKRNCAALRKLGDAK